MLEKEWIRRLERLQLVSKKRVRAHRKGERRSQQYGSSTEFANFRPYMPGDDIRRVDWNLYARTHKPYVKQYLDEQELQVHLFIDTSRSMDFGTPTKLVTAKRLAASLAYIALNGYDRVSVRTFADQPCEHLPLTGGKGAAAGVFAFLSSIQARGEGDFARAFSRMIPRQPGMSILLSDFLVERDALFTTLRRLQAARQELLLLQIWTPEERRPEAAGDIRMIDSESERALDITLSPKARKEYAKKREAYSEAIGRFVKQRNIGWAEIDTDHRPEDVILRTLRQTGWIR